VSDAEDGDNLRRTVENLGAELVRTQGELQRLRGAIPAAAFVRTRRWLLPAGIAIGLSVLAGTRLVVADTPPLAGEVVPRQIPYRGYLEENGTAKTGQANMTFELYPDTASSTPLWSESRTVAVVDGNFSVDLGDRAPPTSCAKDLGAALVANPPSLYLAIKVGNNALSGRQRLMSTPYAQHAGDGVPSGAVMYFNLAKCPSGWSELPTAQGRAIIGLPVGAKLGATVGDQALTAQQPNLQIAHSHVVDAHHHDFSGATIAKVGAVTDEVIQSATSMYLQYPGAFVRDTITNENAWANHTHDLAGVTGSSGSTTSTQTISTSSLVPYVQFLVCQRN
jgi:hypothetical protein